MKWKNIVERCGPPMTIWRMRIACWIPKATKTHSEHVILVAFPQQQWLHEHASTLRYRVLLGFTAVTTRTVILFVTSSRYLKTFTEKYILHLQGEIHISTITSAICYFNKLRQCNSVIPAVGSRWLEPVEFFWPAILVHGRLWLSLWGELIRDCWW